MNIGFLCPAHRLWLSNNLEDAADCWSEGLETAQILFDQKRWRDALPHIGCAFEVAEIMLTAQVGNRRRAISSFACATTLLADTFCQLGKVELGEAIYESAIARLRREAQGGEQGMYPRLYLEYLGKAKEQLAQRKVQPEEAPVAESGWVNPLAYGYAS